MAGFAIELYGAQVYGEPIRLDGDINLVIWIGADKRDVD